MEWPIYFKDNLIKGDQNSPVGVCTMWSDKRKVAQGLPDDFYSVTGNLYSSDGINYILRNILANPRIRHLVICGEDASGESGQAIKSLMADGVDDNNRIKNNGFQLHKEIDQSAIELFRQKVNLVDCSGVSDPFELKQKINSLDRDLPPFSDQPLVFTETKPVCEVYPSEERVFITRGKLVAEVWIKLLDLILKFGLINKTQYTVPQKEILDLITIVSEEDPDNVNHIDDFPYSREHLEKYYPQVLSAQSFPELKYTYGQRIFDAKGINQVDYIIESLKEAGHTRRAVLCLWDPSRDEWNAEKKEWVKENQPCLNLIQCRIQGNRLMMTVYIRSNDMFKAWPENAFAMRKLQQLIQKGVSSEIKLGDLIIISHSAHIYEQDWEKAQAVVKKLASKYLETTDFLIDPRGNFYIYLKDNQIAVNHYSPSGDLIQEFKGQTAVELKTAIMPFVSRIDHAFYLGGELEKAEMALKEGREYNQDRVKF